MKKTIILSSDHGGFELKEKFKKYFKENNYKVVDLGTYSPEKCSYAIKGRELGKRIAKNYDKEIGIGICGTGLGISYALNRIKKVRAARVVSEEDGRLAKLHNNANVLVFGGRQISFKKALEIFKVFEKTKFEGGRHIARIEELDK